MKFSELPTDTQVRLKEDINRRVRNTSYEVYLLNKSGTRFFQAIRKQIGWSDNNGNYMPFGGGSEWHIKYGEIGFSYKKQIMGYDYEICIGKLFCVAKNETIVPKSVKTKKEVMDIAKSIGIFNV